MPDSVATILRESREQQNVSLREVAARLNIRYVYLEAIENGEFGKLPGTTYAIGFLRSYADHLGLDGGDLVNRFKAEVAGLSKQTELVFPTPVPEGKVPGGALILVSVLFLALAYGAWSYFSSHDEQVAEVVPVVPERLQDLLELDRPGTGAETAGTLPSAESNALAASPAEPAASEAVAGASPEVAGEEVVSSQSEEGSTASLETAPFETAPIGSEVTASAADPQTGPGSGSPPVAPGPRPEAAASDSTASMARTTAPAAEPVADTTGQAPVSRVAETRATTAETPAPEAIPAAPSTDETAVAYRSLEAQVYGRGNLDARIVLRATQDAWVQVRDSNEDLLFTRVLRAGDSYRVPNRAGLTLLTGNAGGLDVEVDGKGLGPLGPVGSVRRNVVLEPEKLQDGSR